MTSAEEPGAGYELVVPTPVQRQIDLLAGKRTGLRAVAEQLARDPYTAELGAYRLSGALQTIVCGLHLKRGYRLAFTA